MKRATTVLLLALMAACGGGGSSGGSSASPTATSLSYQPPTATTGYSLVQDPASTATHLVLDLVGPAGTQTRGVALFLAVDASKATWSGGPYVTAGTVLPLGTGTPLLAAKVQQGALQAGIFQQNPTPTTLAAAPGSTYSAPILTVALDLVTGATAGTVTLVPQAGKTGVTLNGDGTTSPLVLNVGTLTAK